MYMRIKKDYFKGFSVKDFNGNLKNYIQYLITGIEDGWYTPSKAEEEAYLWMKEAMRESDDNK